MIDTLLKPLIEQLEAAPWIDRVYGRAYPLQYTHNGQRLTLPVACGIHPDECIAGGDSILLPNDRYGAIAFFEQAGTGQFLEQIRRSHQVFDHYSVPVRLMVWYQAKRLGLDRCDNTALLLDLRRRLYAYQGSLGRNYGAIAIPGGLISGGTLEIETRGIPAPDGLFARYTLDQDQLFDYGFLGLDLTLHGVWPCAIDAFTPDPAAC